ncbi:MAG: hypothetical protein KC445_00835 [Anaerolineales bacterium]|nr:hypothetical protein [Anaerolineales bacterium]
MNSKERVLAAMRRDRTPDRVPVQFDLCRKLTDAFSQKYNIPVHYTTSYYEDITYRISANELKTAMGSDCVVVGGSLPRGYSHPTPSPGRIINEFGMLMEQGPMWMQVIEPPLRHVETVQEVLDHPFPDPYANGRFDDAKKYIEMYKDDYFIIGDLELSIYEMSWHMVGMEKFMLDMAMGEEYIGALLDRVKEFSIGIGKQLAVLGVDAIWTGDDFGGQNGMLISPKMWRELFKPRHAELFQAIKAANPDVLIIYHTDGAVSPIIEDLIEIGVDILNPVQPNVPGMAPHELKAKFGDRLSFFGAIDQQDLLPNGTPEEIAADVASKIEALGGGGGYMCSSGVIIQEDVSLENVEALISAVKKHGVYS